MSGDASAGPRFRASPDAHAVELDGEALIWEPHAEELHRLNPSAARIWRELSEWRTIAEIATAITVEADVDRSRVTRDVAACVEQLAEVGLLEHSSTD